MNLLLWLRACFAADAGPAVSRDNEWPDDDQTADSRHTVCKITLWPERRRQSLPGRIWFNLLFLHALSETAWQLGERREFQI